MDLLLQGVITIKVMANDEVIKSLDSEIRGFVNFINVTQRTVDVCWMNYSGKPIHYTSILPGASAFVSFNDLI